MWYQCNWSWPLLNACSSWTLHQCKWPSGPRTAIICQSSATWMRITWHGGRLHLTPVQSCRSAAAATAQPPSKGAETRPPDQVFVVTSICGICSFLFMFRLRRVGSPRGGRRHSCDRLCAHLEWSSHEPGHFCIEWTCFHPQCFSTLKHESLLCSEKLNKPVTQNLIWIDYIESSLSPTESRSLSVGGWLLCI